MSTQQNTPVTEEDRRIALRRMRTLATGLLVAAALIWLATVIFTDSTGVWGFVKAGSEAAMIGALADWFAVTALFRHPLGLPIPHTAIIPRKKDVLGESLSAFVASNFLTYDTVAPKVESARVTQRVGAWLSKPSSQDAVVRRAGMGLQYVLDRVDDDAVADLTRDVLVPRLIQVRKAPVLGRLMQEIVADGAHEHLVDLVAGEAHSWLLYNPQVVDDIVSQRAPEWVPRFANRMVSDKLHREIVGWIADVRDNRSHRARGALNEWLTGIGTQLQEESSLAERVEATLADMLSREAVVTSAVAMWESTSRLLRESVLDADGTVQQKLRAGLAEFAARMTDDEAFANKWNHTLAVAVADGVESFGGELTSVISDTIASWDAREAAEKIELYVGKDLQYIRINGTVIGCLAGLLIHTVAVLIGG